MKLLVTLLTLSIALSTYSQKVIWNETEYYMPRQEKQYIGDIEITAGVTLLLGGVYLSTQDQVKTQGGRIPCFVLGGVLTIEGRRMLRSVGSKRDRRIIRRLRRKQRNI
tara:strand:+ start:336 stop:662 length:327 start_codon:yes stop_codon:yes gene_type:complete